MAAQSPDQLSHVRIPLKVQASDGSRLGIALVALAELDVFQKRQVAQKIAFPEKLSKVPAIVREPCKADYPDVRYHQAFHIQDVHPLSSSGKPHALIRFSASKPTVVQMYQVFSEASRTMIILRQYCRGFGKKPLN
jgi:hypothetical protein